MSAERGDFSSIAAGIHQELGTFRQDFGRIPAERFLALVHRRPLTRIDGEIAEERRRQELVEVRKSHLRVEARIEGEAEGTRIAAFLQKLACYDNGDGEAFKMGPERAMAVFEMLRHLDAEQKRSADKRAAVEALGQGTAQLYVLPDDVNLHFGSFQNPMRPGERVPGVPVPMKDQWAKGEAPPSAHPPLSAPPAHALR